MIFVDLIFGKETHKWRTELKDVETDRLICETPWRKNREEARKDGWRKREELLAGARAGKGAYTNPPAE